MDKTASPVALAAKKVAAPPPCTTCEFFDSCGGGYLPHRFSVTSGFHRESVFCSDLKILIPHIRQRLKWNSRGAWQQAYNARPRRLFPGAVFLRVFGSPWYLFASSLRAARSGFIFDLLCGVADCSCVSQPVRVIFLLDLCCVRQARADVLKRTPHAGVLRSPRRL
jgi:hypothetical protein